MKIRNLTPSITNSSEEILKIAGQQLSYHRTEDFSNILKENEKMILELIGCDEGRVIFLTSSGTGAMDATVNNLIQKDEKILIINGGDFAQKWVDICKFYNLDFEEFKVDFGKSIDFGKLQSFFEKIKPKFVLCQHVETSSGEKHNVNKIGDLCKKFNSYLIVDSISGFGNDEYFMDDWGADATILCTQKGLSLHPGISMIILGKNMFNLKLLKRNFYFDFNKYMKKFDEVGLPFTPNMVVLNQLNYKLKEIKKEGLQKFIDRRKNQAEDFRKKIINLPLKIIADNPSNAVTALYTDRKDVKKFFRDIQSKGIYFSPSGGEEGKKFVVGHMGEIDGEANSIFVEEIKKWLGSEAKKRKSSIYFWDMGSFSLRAHKYF